MSNKLGKTQKKLLILLAGTASMAFTYSPLKQYEILREMNEEWENVNNQSFKRSLDSLFKSDLLLKKVCSNGNIIYTLSEKGADIASEYLLGSLVIGKNKKWDKKWRIIMFDIPEEYRSVRNAIRYRLNKLAFVELQKSVFISPFDCMNIISKMVDFYKVNKHVRFITAEKIDNEKDLKNKFKLN